MKNEIGQELMALVKCSECDNIVSVKATSCPKCGSSNVHIDKKGFNGQKPVAVF